MFLTNEIIFFLEIIIVFSSLIPLYHYFGKEGLYAWIPLSIILANIVVYKQINLFGIEATGGNIVIFSASFLITDFLAEHFGREASHKAVNIGFASFIMMVIITQLTLLYIPNEFDKAQPALMSLFAPAPALLLASLAAYWLSQKHDVWAFHFWKKLFPSRKYLWLRNNASSIVSQLLDTFVFLSIAILFKIFPREIFLELFISTYVLKLFISFLDTPFLYWLSHMQTKKDKKMSEVTV